MKRIFLSGLLVLIFFIIIHGQAVYVDSNVGNDDNPGTEKAPLFSINKAAEIISEKNNDIFIMKINPGIYVVNKHITVFTKKYMDTERIVIEAAILPDDPKWTPEKMPILLNRSQKGDIPDDFNFISTFLINESHVTIRGIKFPGYFYPNSKYFPVSRFNKGKTDLFVEQCLFVGDEQACPIQVGIIAHGNEINIDHCIFYNAKNAAIYWEDSGDGDKSGNSMTNCIISGAYQCAIWTAWPDKDFIFKNNIVTNCKYVWIKNKYNKAKYSIENSIIVNNQHFTGVADNGGVIPEDFEIAMNKVILEGKISLRLIENIVNTLPIDYFHILPNTTGYNLEAGLFKHAK